MKYLWMLLAAGLLLFSACGEEEVDVAAPGMEILNLDPEPVPAMICGTMEDTVFHLRGGETLDFTVVFRDDAALSQYKIDIHNNFDCHGHGGGSTPGIALPDVSSLTEDWTVLDIQELSGREQMVTRELRAPDDVTAGTYHFQVQVLDEAGNDNPLANFYSLKVLNPRDEEPPVISVAQPSGDFSAGRGETVRFEGEVTDNYSLSEGGNGIVFLTYTDLSSGNTFTTETAAVAFDATVDKTYTFSLDFTVPATIQPGDFRFSLRAHDGVRNVAEPVEFLVEVTP